MNNGATSSNLTVKKRERQIYLVTGVGSLVNIGLFVVKLLAGIFGRSSAMIADAVHSLTDFITDIIVVVFVRLSSKPADLTHTYGHGKFETLATAFIGLSMSAVGVMLLVHAVEKIWGAFHGNKVAEPEMIAFWAAILSIVAKEILFHYTHSRGEQLRSPAVMANAWHHRSDALSSVCTAFGIGGAILLGGQWAVLDPIAAAVVSLFIVKVGIKTIRPCFDELLERSLPRNVRNEIAQTIAGVPGAGHPHHILTRRIGTRYAIEVNLHLDGKMPLKEACAISDDVMRALKDKFGQHTHVGVHFKILLPGEH